MSADRWPPSPPQTEEIKTMDGGPAATATADPASQVAPPASVVEPTPPPPPPEGETTDADSEPDGLALPTDEPAPEEQTATEATTQPLPPPLPMPTKAEEVIPTAPPSEPPPPEMVATTVEAEKQPPATEPPLQPPPPPPPEMVATKVEADKEPPATEPPLQPLQQQQEGGAMEEASSVDNKEEKDATPARAQQEGEDKQPEKKQAAPAGAQEGRRRWRQLQAAVRLIFLRCKIGDRSTPQSPLPEDKGGDTTKQPKPKDKESTASGLEDKKTTPPEKPQRKDSASDVKPAAPDVEEPASGPKVAEKPPATAPLAPQPSTGGIVRDKPEAVKQKDEGERSKGCHDENKQAPVTAGESQAGAVAGAEAGPDGSPAVKTTNANARFQKVGNLVRQLISWYRRHRSSGTEERKGDEIKPAAAPDGDKGADAGSTKTAAPADDDGKQPATSGPEAEKKPHPKWVREEGRLEKILEDAFTRLLATEFHQLRSIRKKCLLTFSVFDLAAEVKKQVMVYWWVSEFNLHHRIDQSAATDAAAPAETRRRSRILRRRARRPPAAAAPAGGNNNSPAPPQGDKAGDAGNGNPDAAAEGIFSELSSHGFLEPARNWCTRVIHGCKVNPLVHWMVKRRARDDSCADLDVNGKPSELQRESDILCLTAGNRPLLQEMRMKDDKYSQQTDEDKDKPNATRTTSTSQQSTTQEKAPDQGQKNTETNIDREPAAILQSLIEKRVILNVNAHVYPISKSMFLHLADNLVVLQLGRWCNLDDKTYMEVDGLESLSEIGLLKNLRCLSLRGLSRLTELPKGIQGLKKLAILDMRGCQNLVNVKITMPLNQLTHLDLTECYMLEHIGRGITSLTELQVFKGFVFPTGTQGNKACRVKDLKNLKNLQKLTISIATEANVGKDDMAELKHLTTLHKLTITWSEIPRILDDDSEIVKEKRERLVKKWTSFDIPQELSKLDLRCYPKKELQLKVQKNLKKLYLRGGELEKFSIIDEPKSSNSSDKVNCITTLRLRYLKNFKMDWEDICKVLKDIEYLEIVPKDEKPIKAVDKDQKDENTDIKDQNVDVEKDKKDKNINMKDQGDKNLDNKDQKDIGEMHKLMENIDMKDQEDKNIDAKDQKDIEADSKLVMKKRILYSILDENGVWMKDSTEEKNLQRLKDLCATEKSKGSIHHPSTEDTSSSKENQKGQNNIGSNP